MSTYAIYFSPTNGTQNVVKALAGEFGDYKGVDLCSREADTDMTFAQGDVCIVAVPSYGGRVPAALQRMSGYKGNGAKAILVVVYGNRAYEDTLRELQDYLTARDFDCTAAVAAIAEHSIMRQFASGRPNDSDKKQLAEFSRQIISKISQNAPREPLKLAGNYPYKDYNGVPLKPKAGKSCTKCALCAKMCPVAAIPADDPQKTDNSICISCMRCVSICPAKARKLNALMLKVALKGLEKACSTRKENELFI